MLRGLKSSRFGFSRLSSFFRTVHPYPTKREYSKIIDVKVRFEVSKIRRAKKGREIENKASWCRCSLNSMASVLSLFHHNTIFILSGWNAGAALNEFDPENFINHDTILSLFIPRHPTKTVLLLPHLLWTKTSANNPNPPFLFKSSTRPHFPRGTSAKCWLLSSSSCTARVQTELSDQRRVFQTLEIQHIDQKPWAKRDLFNGISIDSKWCNILLNIYRVQFMFRF